MLTASECACQTDCESKSHSEDRKKQIVDRMTLMIVVQWAQGCKTTQNRNQIHDHTDSKEH